MEKLLLIDGNSLINRAFYALPFFTNKKGEHTGAVFGFANMLLKVIELQQPSHIIVAFDFARKTFRNDIFADYKGTRKETPIELRSQFALVKEMLDKMSIVHIEKKGIEADDVIGTICKNFIGQTYVLTGDRDILQLLDEKTFALFTKKGITEIDTYTASNIKEKYGVEANQVVELKALMGDKSDNIPGLAGVGPKTAMNLLGKYGNIENIYKNLEYENKSIASKFIEGRDIIEISRKLATIKTDCELELNFDDCKLNMPFDNSLRDFFEDMEFSSLLKKNEIFKKQIKTNTIQNIPLNTTKDLDYLVFEIQNCKKFGFCLLGETSFAFDEHNYVLSKEITLFSNIVSLDECLKKLKPIFEDPNIKKFTWDLKSQLPVLAKYDISISQTNIFDYSIARYLIWAGTKLGVEEVNAGYVIAKSGECFEYLDELGLNDLYNKIELPLTFVLHDMEKTGFKIDSAELFSLKSSYEKLLEDLQNQIWDLAGCEFNIKSPKQVADIIFDKLGMKSYIDKKRSTNIEVLNELSNQHPIIPLVIHFRKIYKLFSTYVLPYVDIVNKQGDLITTVFNQTLTSTGRLSSSEPNLQNIPVRDDEGKNLRKLFISRFDDGVIMSADYNQIELRLLADFSGDKNMIDAFNHNIDIHSKTACEIFDVDVASVTPQMRRDAKTVNFGIVYGISDYGLATGMSISRKVAKAYIEKYFLSYPAVKTYQTANIEKAKAEGMIKTLFGRIRRVPELQSSNYMLRQFGERVVMNAPLQGSASDIIKIAMIYVYNELKNLNLKSKLILQIHDELILDVSNDEIDICKNLLKKCMEQVVKLKVALPVEIEFGKNWYFC